MAEEKYRNFEHSRAKAIKEHCLECSGFIRSERQRCPAKGCALWAFRNGYEVDANNQRIKKIVRDPLQTGLFNGVNAEKVEENDDDFDSDDEDEQILEQE